MDGGLRSPRRNRRQGARRARRDRLARTAGALRRDFARARYPKATLYRLLQTLTSQGMLVFGPEGQYLPARNAAGEAGALGLGAVLAGADRPGARRPAVRCDRRDGASGAARQRPRSLCRQAQRSAPDRNVQQGGQDRPGLLHTGVGKAMLAWLDDAALEDTLRRQAFHRFMPNTLTDPGRSGPSSPASGPRASRSTARSTSRASSASPRRSSRARPDDRRRLAHLDHRAPPAGRSWLRWRPTCGLPPPRSRPRRSPGNSDRASPNPDRRPTACRCDAERRPQELWRHQGDHGVDLQIDNGEFCVFVGPSGCGKSTLLRMVAGLEETTGGSIAIGGPRRHRVDPSGARRRDGVPDLRALSAHDDGGREHGVRPAHARVPKAEIDAKGARGGRHPRLDALMGRQTEGALGRPAPARGDRARDRAGTGGVPVRRAALEPRRRAARGDAGRDREAPPEIGATMIYVTHDQVEAMTLADKIVVLRAGRIEQVGAPLTLYDDPDNVFIAGFIGSPRMNMLAGEVAGNDACRRHRAPRRRRGRPFHDPASPGVAAAPGRRSPSASVPSISPSTARPGCGSRPTSSSIWAASPTSMPTTAPASA